MGPEEEKRAKLDEQYKRDAIQFIVNANATIVNMRLYPLTSSMVTSTLEKAQEYLETIMENGTSFMIGALEGVILINEYRLEDIDQQKPPIKSFANWLFEHGFTSIEFTPGVTGDELQDVLQVLVNSENDIEIRENIDAHLMERNVLHININQRVYVSLESGTEIGEGGPGSPLDAMKDELLVRYLMGTVDLENIEDKEVMEVLSDTRRVGGMMSAFLSLEGPDEGVLIKSQKAEDALRALYDMINRIEDDSLKGQLMGQVSSVIAEMSPTVMSSVLTSTPPADLNIHNLRKDVVTMLGDQKLLELIDALIGDYIGMKEESGELDVDWMRQKLVNFNQLFLEARVGEGGEELSEQIDKLLEDSGIHEEREPETGKKVLSAYQLLGTPLEEEMVELDEGVDRTVSRQIYQLYTMGENELAEGFLNKICDNLDNESAKVRRFAATLLHDTIDGLDPEYGVTAGEIIEPILLERSKVETDYTAFTTEIDTLVIAAEHSLRKGQAGKASEIVEVLSVIDSHEEGKGSELLKHLKSVLEKMRGPDGIVSVHYVLLEEDQKVRDDIIKELARIGPGALAPLVDIVKDRGQVELQPRALEAFQVAGPAGVSALMDVLDRDNSWFIYRNVLNAIADLGLREAVPKVNEMVNNADERVRREAIRTLARLGSRESLPIIRNAISDPSPAVRQIAVRVLGVFRDKRVAPFLVELLNEAGPRGKGEDKGVVEAACLAIGDLKDSDYIPNLIEVLGKGGLFRRAKPDEIRAAACIALGNIGDPIAEPILEKAATESSAMVSSCANKALKKLRGALTTPVPATEEEITKAVDTAPSEQAASVLRSMSAEKAEGETQELAVQENTPPEPPAEAEPETAPESEPASAIEQPVKEPAAPSPLPEAPPEPAPPVKSAVPETEPAVEAVEEAPKEEPPAQEAKVEEEGLGIGAAGQDLEELREEAPAIKELAEEAKVEEASPKQEEQAPIAGPAVQVPAPPEPEPSVESAEPETAPAETLPVEIAGLEAPETAEPAPEEIAAGPSEYEPVASGSETTTQAQTKPEPPAAAEPTPETAPAVEAVEETSPEKPPAEEAEFEEATTKPVETAEPSKVEEEGFAQEAPAQLQAEVPQPVEIEEKHPTQAEIEEIRQLEEIEAMYESGHAEPAIIESEIQREEVAEGVIERSNIALEDLLATAEASLEKKTDRVPGAETAPESDLVSAIEQPVKEPAAPSPLPEAPPEPAPPVESAAPETAPAETLPVEVAGPEAPEPPAAAEPTPEPAVEAVEEAPKEEPPAEEAKVEEATQKPEEQVPVTEPAVQVPTPPEPPASVEPEPAPEPEPASIIEKPVEEPAAPPPLPEVPPEPAPSVESAEPETAPAETLPVEVAGLEAPESVEPAPEEIAAGPSEYEPSAPSPYSGPLIPEEELPPWELESAPPAEEAPPEEDMMEEEPLDGGIQQEVPAGPEIIPAWDYGPEDQPAPPEAFPPPEDALTDQGVQPPDSYPPSQEPPPEPSGLPPQMPDTGNQVPRNTPSASPSQPKRRWLKPPPSKGGWK